MSSEHNAVPADQRQPSLLDASCDNFAHDLAALSPTEATAMGIPGFDAELQDFSPEYYASVADRMREMIADLDALDDGTDDSDDDDDFDEVDYVTAAVIRNRLCLELDLHHHGEDIRNLNNLESPVQIIRDTLSLMPTETPEQREALASRVSKIGAALEGHKESLRLAASHGKVAAIRQINEVIGQCNALADGPLLSNLGLPEDSSEVEAARQSFGEFSSWLSTELQPQAPEKDAFGRERYQRFSRLFVGDVVDLDEAYEWGLERVSQIRAEQEKIGLELYGEANPKVTQRRLNEEERYTLHGREALVEWMQRTADTAISALGDQFDMPEPMRTIECRIDPAGTGGIFYTPPADDFSRPGRMWWSVPTGQDTFHTWQELTTVHHEGVPGHHLQICAAMLNPDLNLWRRAACWNSGHGEGWALYAEQLMADLGYMDDPGYRMGLLDAQMLRAARVVVDIGLHLGKQMPDGSGVWDKAHVKTYLRERVAMDDANLSFEVNRYLGWAGQAPSYALGERLWQQLRDDAVAQGTDIKDFHARALALGSIPMSIMRDTLLN